MKSVTTIVVVGRAHIGEHLAVRSAETCQGVLSHWAEIRGHELLN
jgi:hypothetical protein